MRAVSVQQWPAMLAMRGFHLLYFECQQIIAIGLRLNAFKTEDLGYAGRTLSSLIPWICGSGNYTEQSQVSLDPTGCLFQSDIVGRLEQHLAQSRGAFDGPGCRVK